MNRKEQQLQELIAPTVDALGCELWGIEYVAQGRRSLLRIFIERPDGVSVEDCERVSRQVSGLLDVEDPIKTNYRLEVSSPGFDRLLFRPDQYLRYLGETLDVRLNFPYEGRRKFVGQLVGLEDNEVVLRIEDEEYLLPLENVQRARIVPTFE